MFKSLLQRLRLPAERRNGAENRRRDQSQSHDRVSANLPVSPHRGDRPARLDAAGIEDDEVDPSGNGAAVIR